MGYVFTLGDVYKYLEWCQKPYHSRLVNAGMDLCRRMLNPQPMEEVLDVGCGSCLSLLKMLETGAHVTGLEASPIIASVFSRKFNLTGVIDVGDACDMPYEDNAFSYTYFFNSLEYIENPREALAETFRVTRQKVFIGFFNRYAMNYFAHRIKNLSGRANFAENANFFSLWDIKKMVYDLLGPVPIKWEALMVMPFFKKTPNLHIVKFMPFSAFIGLTITVNPRLTTTGLTLKHKCEVL